MNGFVHNLERLTLENQDYRRVLYTSRNSQLVLMCVQPGDEIGEETHHLDQFIRIEQGTARVHIDENEHVVERDWAMIIPAGARHNVINIGTDPLKLYTLYAPPEHRHDTVQATKADEREEHFDGTTTE